MPLRILHLADLHLGWEPRFLPEAARRAWQQERDGRLAQAVQSALQLEPPVDLAVIAGDLFDRHDPPEPLVQQAARALESLVQAGVAVVTVPGNHDEVTYPNSVWRVWGSRWPGLLVTHPNPAPLGPLQTRGGPVWIYSLAYTGGVTRAWPPVEALPPRQAEEGWHVGVFHGTVVDRPGGQPVQGWQGQGWPGSAGSNLQERSLPLSLQALEGCGYHYVALGHIHQHRRWQLGATLACYCGAPDARGFDDPGVGFFTVATLGEGGAQVEQVPFSRRPVITADVDVGPFATVEELVRSLVRGLELERSVRPLVRVRLQGVCSFRLRPEQVERELEPWCLHVRVEDQTEGLSEERLEELAREPTVRGLLVRRLREAIRQADQPAARRRMVRALQLALAALEGGP